MTIDALKKQIQTETFSELYYFSGEEQYLIDLYSDRLKDCCSAVLPEFNYIEMASGKPPRLLEAPVSRKEKVCST